MLYKTLQVCYYNVNKDSNCYLRGVIAVYFRLYHFKGGFVKVQKAIKILTRNKKYSYMGVIPNDEGFTVCVGYFYQEWC
jgi:hypothetical protein|nr:MAG TPA: hypothetical protein [Bacteriophage sp.]